MPQLIPTMLVYTIPNFEESEKKKNAYLLTTLGENYNDLSLQSKWLKLMSAFASIDRQYSSLLLEFTQKRLNCEKNNRHVLQLDQCLSYFEFFFFLIKNSDPLLQLNPKEKNNLFKAISRGMQPHVCETGITMFFEDSLHTYIKDLDWIFEELYKQRRNLLQEIADEYIANNAVADTMSIHVLMHVYEIAKQHNFGVKPSQEIWDIYVPKIFADSIASYFTMHFPQKSSFYRKNIIVNLSQYALLELNGLLKNHAIDTARWTDEAIECPLEALDFLTDYHKRFFSVLDSAEVSNALGKMNEEGVFFLRKKPVIFQHIKALIRKQLVLKGLFFEFDEKQAMLPENIHLSLEGGISQKELKHFVGELQKDKIPDLKRLVKNSNEILRHYPGFLLHRLIQHPRLWSAIDPSLKTDYNFLRLLIKEIGKQLLSEQEYGIPILVEILWYIVKPNPDYLRLLPNEVWQSSAFVLLLVDKDGLQIKRAHPTLKTHPTIKERATAQNPFVSYLYNSAAYDVSRKPLYSQLPKLNKYSYQIHRQLLSQEDKLIAIENIYLLLTIKNLSISQLIRLTQKLTPTDLLQIIEDRETLRLPPLPFVQRDGLSLFKDSTNEALWKHHGYLGYKRDLAQKVLVSQPYLSSKYSEYIAQSQILANNNWFLAYMKFQKHFPSYSHRYTSWGDVLLQFSHSFSLGLEFLNSLSSYLTKTVMSLLNGYLSYLILKNYDIVLWKLTDYIYFNFLTMHFAYLLIPLVLAEILLGRFPSESFASRIFLITLLCLVIPPFQTILLAAEYYLVMLEIITLSLYSIAGLIKVFSMAKGRDKSWAELKVVMSAILLNYAMYNLYLLWDLFTFAAKTFYHLLFEWPALLIPAFFMPITRAFVTLHHWFTSTSTVSSPEERKITQVDQFLQKLILNDDPADAWKIEIFEDVWNKVLHDYERGVSLDSAMEIPHKMLVQGEEKELSFKQLETLFTNKKSSAKTEDCEQPKQGNMFSFFFGSTAQTSEANTTHRNTNLTKIDNDHESADFILASTLAPGG